MALTPHVVRTDLWIDPVFDQRLRAGGAQVAVIAVQGDPGEAYRAFVAAHVYQVSAAKHELPLHTQVTAGLLARCPDLLCVSSNGAGYDTVDVAACTMAGVAVVNQAGGNAISVAEHTFGLMLGVSRRMVECDRRMRAERGFSREQVMGHEIHGKTLGIVGIGHTGTRVAHLARAFGMDVLATDPYVGGEEIALRGARAASLHQLLAESDVISLHCPRNGETMRMLDAAAYARMKQGAMLLTTARGGIHDEDALADALRSGHLAGAGLDVWDVEPPPLDHPLLRLPNVFASYHMAGVTHEARRNMAAIAAEQVLGLLKGARPPRLINPEVWPRVAARRQALGLA